MSRRLAFIALMLVGVGVAVATSMLATRDAREASLVAGEPPRAPVLQSATETPTALPTFTALPFVIGGYPAPNSTFVPSPAPNATWTSLDADGVAQQLLADIGNATYPESSGPVTVITATNVYTDDAATVGVMADQILRNAYPDVVVVIAGSFTRHGLGLMVAYPVSGTPIPTVIATAEPPIVYSYALYVIDRGFGTYYRVFSNDLDSIMNGVP